MKFNGKEAETRVFKGATAEEANANMLSSSAGMNLLNADVNLEPDGSYTIIAIFEKSSGRQQLNEG